MFWFKITTIVDLANNYLYMSNNDLEKHLKLKESEGLYICSKGSSVLLVTYNRLFHSSPSCHPTDNSLDLWENLKTPYETSLFT